MTLAHQHRYFGFDGCHDVREQPRCTRCGCRRIYHFRAIRSARGHVLEEVSTPCSLLMDGWPCGCNTYTPAALRVVR